jgi:AraC-like DNA-binding protein
VEFNWIRNMIYASAAGIVIFFLFDVMGQIFPWADGYSFYWYPYFFLGILLYYITISGYHGFDRLHELLHFEPEKDDETVLENPKPAFPLDEKLKSELVRLMDREKPYLEPELTLSDLSKRLNSNPSVISKLVNDGFGQNFNDFVNEYRVREVMQKLKAGEQARQTLLGIALDSGFNSKATFNRSFKKLTGKSPRDWMSDIETT